MKRLKKLDYFIVIPYLIMSIIGIIMVYSASANIGTQNGGSPTSYLIKQSVFVVLSLIIVTFMMFFNLNKLRNQKLLQWIEIAFYIGLVYLLMFGQSINGASGWINLGPVNLQPAEFLKFFLIIRIANFVDLKQDELMDPDDSWWLTMRPTLIRTGLLLLLVLAQPDSGGFAINFMIVAIMLLASGIPWRRSVTILGGFILAIILSLMFVIEPLSKMDFAKSSYRIQRFVAFLDPFGHATGTGQQLVNSYYAISNGGLFGVGLGNSIQKTGYLPEPNTDFIMAILSEELGVLTVIMILFLLMVIVCRCVLLGIRSNDTFQSLVCYGGATYLTVQSLFNIGGVIGALPITGVTFPFISYGGSSILTLSLCIGVILNISDKQRQERQRVIKE
ncbi:stage V sporulation protein E [Lentilactobacillus senioris DSM 24302 = JCM 17472]|uniref:Probable peptidoglycan glycosyltransferase FtsW n=1 Tax=Lentilactobacillus senioris DSM 24302 = JCM 17472 TaxID=1423802 RepID=A0A0R2CQD2_9LACO|nr:FtsW/RodA/SpoVE family cell cycle protein [Lentilactobacillus senioris]KRM94047.1 stage V sporulation protein E [Lentilactobacillus senioris DSM 24302 = JCM 17472]